MRVYSTWETGSSATDPLLLAVAHACPKTCALQIKTTD